jgi:murein DD-endopeptidase MepM/ murein hydrolase activator NlpD
VGSRSCEDVPWLAPLLPSFAISMIEVPVGAPVGMRWSRCGPIRAAGLTFICFITVLAAAPVAGADNGTGISRFAEWRLPAEDRALPRPPEEAPPERPSRLLELCPVDPPRHYIDDFGAPRAGHRHQGNDIMAPRGSPIRAPFDGTAKVSSSWAGGLGVYVHGKRGFVFNAHLSRLGKLGKVKAGDVIGYVGNSGNASGGSTHDHFEWHPGGGNAVDPFRLLNAVCRGGPPPPAPPPKTSTIL